MDARGELAAVLTAGGGREGLKYAGVFVSLQN
jgi:hypothetical protein